MARIMKFEPSTSPDVVGYKMYIQEAPDPVEYTSEGIDLGMPPADADGKLVVDLSTLAALTTKDGVYNIGVVAIDDAGNESSMTKATNVPLDFVAPDPPGALEFS